MNQQNNVEYHVCRIYINVRAEALHITWHAHRGSCSLSHHH